MSATAEQLQFPERVVVDNSQERLIKSAAFARVQRIGKELLNCRAPRATLAEWDLAAADLRTSLADARIANSLASGIPMRDIDPTTGNEFSERIYLALRKSYQRSYDRSACGLLGWDLDELQEVAETARQEFLAKRPDLDDGRLWITSR